MSNDSMSKEIQMTNYENTSQPCERRFSSFRPRHLFVIRHSCFGILSRLLLVLLVAVCVSCSGKRITKANVDEVEERMSKKQVESILGRPNSISNEDPAIMKKTTYVYQQGKDSVRIVFKDDKVQSKESTLSK
jgi:hypothetical protein